MIAVAFLLVIIGKADAIAQNTSLGPTIGVNGWENSDNKIKVGLNIGATFVYSIDPHWGIGAELKFSMEGGGETIGNETANLTSNYIKLPLKAMYFFGHRGQRLRPKLYAGPSFGLLVGGKINGSYAGVAIPELKSMDYLKHFDLGLLVGTGFNYRLSPGTWLNVDLGYTGGLIDIVKSNTTYSPFAPTKHNHSAALNVGVTFPLGTVKHINTKSKKDKR